MHVPIRVGFTLYIWSSPYSPGEQWCLLLHPFSTTLRLLLLVVSLSVTRGLSVQPTRVNNPCAGGSPAGPVYPVQGPARVLLTSQVMQSYFIVTQAINYVDSLLRDYVSND